MELNRFALSEVDADLLGLNQVRLSFMQSLNLF